jgi:hypothetical protein
MGTDAKGRGCLSTEDKLLIGQQLLLANQHMIEIRGFIQIHNENSPAVDRRLNEISQSLKLVQDLPTCGDEDTLINSARYAARALQKATGEDVYI